MDSRRTLEGVARRDRASVIAGCSRVEVTKSQEIRDLHLRATRCLATSCQRPGEVLIAGVIAIRSVTKTAATSRLRGGR